MGPLKASRSVSPEVHATSQGSHVAGDIPAAEAAPPSALRALCLIARLHHIAADPATLAHQLGWSSSHAVDVNDVLIAARHIGLKAKRSRSTVDRLNLAALPALAVFKAEEGSIPRIVVLAQCDGQRVLFQDPAGATGGLAASSARPNAGSPARRRTTPEAYAAAPPG